MFENVLEYVRGQVWKREMRDWMWRQQTLFIAISPRAHIVLTIITSVRVTEICRNKYLKQYHCILVLVSVFVCLCVCASWI